MKKKQRPSLAIVHFQPLEKYPPVMNLINFLVDNQQFPQVYSNEIRSLQFKFNNAGCLFIKRYGDFSTSTKIVRFMLYLRFIFSASWNLIRSGPLTVLYYESWSALPAIALKICRPKTRLMVHYHEYTSITEYRNSMLLNRASLFLERKFFRRYAWISHTNEERLEMFKNDFKLPGKLNYRLMPNYPPKSWVRQPERTTETTLPVRFVYCGALGIHSTFLIELCDWIKSCNGNALLEIYSHQTEKEAGEYLNKLNCPWIVMKKSVNYFELPQVLPAYHIGLILYKGLTKNYIYNAPNKLFEYLACGLDVWFPEEMKGCYPYITENRYPQVKKIDFKQLFATDLLKIPNRSGMEKSFFTYTCEEVYHDIYKFITRGNA